MGRRDRFTFRQRPAGIFKRILHSPVWLFRLRLGFLFGKRIVMLEHVGRRSGKLRQTPLEVVLRRGDAYVLCSGTGPKADWYRNIRAAPAVALWVGARRYEVEQRFLDDSEAATAFAAYERAHPQAAARLTELMGVSHDGTHQSRVEMVGHIPMVEMRLRS
jgi:deazaflavin-dependent oxidoreductase (nitroreductase family)